MTPDRFHGARRSGLALSGWSVLLLSALVMGCGNLTAGGATGETTVYVVGDEPDATATDARAGPATTNWARLPSGSSSLDDDEPEGELELEFHLRLVTGDGRVVSLTGEEVRIRVEFPGERRVEAATRTVPANDYGALRVAFTEIEAEVDAGLVVNGDTITGPVDVELEDDSLVVDRPIDLQLSEGSRAELVVDMNSTAWLTSVDPETRVVDGVAVAEAIEVRRR